MGMVIIFLKEIAESTIRNLRIFKNKLGTATKSKELSKVLKELKKDGISVESNFYTSEECCRFRKKIDALIESNSTNVWIDESGADHRIYFVNEVDDDFNDFYENSKIRSILKNYTGTNEPKGMLLAARIDAKDGNIGSGGGWHRDSPITHQFKAICYLSDVETEHGPFQFIKKSHLKLDVFKSYLTNLFNPGQYRFNDSEVERYMNKTSKSISELTAEQGTVVYADTKGIHRGKPIVRGSRYVLFCYFWHGEIPKHFNTLRQ
ncbi:phytanoyl-CoA dioxygenase family protein [uncultured Pseudoalteromonas sp.]|uniref:phytanoyl-CoA dioxygenase family protein n=1 Tax=uncultured Pseudoalteromonas sp. TaxID=114053 RepID=UPI0032B2A41A